MEAEFEWDVNDPTPADLHFMQIAYEQAVKSYNEGGIPIGACLASAAPTTGEQINIPPDGTHPEPKLIGASHNQRVQRNSATLHAETACLESVGRLPAAVYKNQTTTMYTTLSPCDMCTGAILLYGIPRVIIGENTTFLSPGEQLLRQRGVRVINLDNLKCKQLMQRFIQEKPSLWNEDIGVIDPVMK